MVERLHPAAELAEERLKLHARRCLPAARVWLFGSRAAGTAGRRSDFDLAVQFDDASCAAACLNAFEDAVAEDLEIIYPVDVVDLKVASEALKDAVVRDGVLWKS